MRKFILFLSCDMGPNNLWDCLFFLYFPFLLLCHWNVEVRRCAFLSFQYEWCWSFFFICGCFLDETWPWTDWTEVMWSSLDELKLMISIFILTALNGLFETKLTWTIRQVICSRTCCCLHRRSFNVLAWRWLLISLTFTLWSATWRVQAHVQYTAFTRLCRFHLFLAHIHYFWFRCNLLTWVWFCYFVG